MKKEKYSSGNNAKRIVTGWTTAFATLMIFTAVTAMLIDNNSINSPYVIPCWFFDSNREIIE